MLCKQLPSSCQITKEKENETATLLLESSIIWLYATSTWKTSLFDFCEKKKCSEQIVWIKMFGKGMLGTAICGGGAGVGGLIGGHIGFHTRWDAKFAG